MLLAPAALPLAVGRPRAATRACISRPRAPVPSRCAPTRRAVVFARAEAVGTSTLPASLPALDDTYASTVAFSDYAHWLIPGHLMAGRYPYVEPSRVSSRSVGEAQLDEIMRAGITRFVCLQAELPPQADMPVGGKDGFLPYRPTATLIAAALSGPPSLEVIEGLRNPHLDTFLPPRRKKDRHAADPVHVAAAAERRRVEVSFGHCPIPDLGVPESGIAAALVDDVIARLSAGERIYLHCWGGRGRAGTIGACVLGKLYSVSAEEALARVDAALRTREPDGRSPEKEEQREFVRAFLGK